MSEIIVERAEIYDSIRNLLRNTQFNRKLCIIHGEFGIGKSTMLKLLESEFRHGYVLNIDLSKVTSDTTYYLKSCVLDFLINNNKKSEFTIPEPEKVFSVLSSILKVPIKVTNEITTLDTEINIGSALSELYQSFTHNNYDSVNDISDDPFWIQLSRIIFRVCDQSKKELFIVVDDYDLIETHTIELINSLLNTELKISLIVSGDKSSERFDQLLQTQFVDGNSNDRFKFELSCFSFDETNQYISKKFQGVQKVNKQLIDSAYQFTRGLPFLLSLVTTDIETLSLTQRQQIAPEKKDKWELYVKKLISEKDSTYTDILEIIALNQNEIFLPILENLLLKNNSSLDQGELYDYIDRMIYEKLLIEKDDLIQFYTPAIGKQLRNNIHLKSRLKTKIKLKRIIKEYNNTPDSICSLHKTRSLVFLHLELNEIDNAFKYIILYIGLLTQNQQFINAINFLNTMLLNKKLIMDSRLNALLIKELCLLHFLSRNNVAVIDTYKRLTKKDLKSIAETEDDIELYHNVARAYYYENNSERAIHFAKKMLKETNSLDTYHYHQAATIICSSLDLNGKYEDSISFYQKALVQAKQDNDLKQIGRYKMMIQMVSNDFNECVLELSEAIDIFKNKQHDNNLLIKSLNNLGIEYLMNGDIKEGLAVLHKAESLLEKHQFLEDHFIFNNIGLGYLLSDPNDLEASNKYFKKALNHAISPLQKAYIHSNLSVLFSELHQFSSAEEQLKLSLYHALRSPDPLVCNYIYYNNSYFEFTHSNLDKAREYFISMGKLMNKVQVNSLESKRVSLANKLGIDYNFELISTTRRRKFAESNWELCELMFYN